MPCNAGMLRSSPASARTPTAPRDSGISSRISAASRSMPAGRTVPRGRTCPSRSSRHATWQRPGQR
ncbi:MAG: hypothetical protein ACK56F_11120, partial [bacterium]